MGYTLQRSACSRASRSSVACCSAMLELFFLYSTPRILHVRLYGMSKFDLKKKLMLLWKTPNPTWKLGSSPSPTFQFPDFRVLFFCPIPIKFGMKVHLVGFYAANEFLFRNSEFGGHQKSKTLPKPILIQHFSSS